MMSICQMPPKGYKYILVLNHKVSQKWNTRDHNTVSSQEIGNTVPKYLWSFNLINSTNNPREACFGHQC
jgi:hypothetical protein